MLGLGGKALFLRKKKKGTRTVFEEKNYVRNAFLYEKMTGKRPFLSEFTFTAFLLMLSCLTFEAECVLCFDIAQLTTIHH